MADFHTFSVFCLLGLVLLAGSASAAAPVALFVGSPTTGHVPLPVVFTDYSTGLPEGYAWFFGDEDYNQTWTLMNASAGWSARDAESCVVLPDGSIVLTGGFNFSPAEWKSDVWRSTDHGATWSLLNASAGWTPRSSHTSEVMPDGRIVMMGGAYLDYQLDDTWQSVDKGVTWTLVNPHSGWGSRMSHASVVMPDGTLILTGGWNISDYVTHYMNDTWKSTDYGVTWTQVSATAPWTARYGMSMLVLPDSSILLAGGFDGTDEKNDVWRSLDEGASWMPVNLSPPWESRHGAGMVVMPDNSVLLMGGYNGPYWNDVWRSTDFGQTWTEVTDNATWGWRQPEDNIVVMRDGSIVMMGGFDAMGLNDVWQLNPAGSSLPSPVHTYRDPGVYNVALRVYNTEGSNTTLIPAYITAIMAPPSADFTATPDTGTVPLTVKFMDNSTNTPTSWNWTFGDGSPENATVSNPVHTYTHPGTYTVSLEVTNAGGSDTTVKTGYIAVSNPDRIPLVLSPGWNFVSTPKRLEKGNDTASIFGNISTGGHSIWRYDTSGRRWEAMRPSTEIEVLEGIWIYSNTTNQVELRFSKDVLLTPRTRICLQGWNAIGFSDLSPASARDTLMSVYHDWSTLIGYDANLQTYETSIIHGGIGAHTDDREMLPGKGYWLYMTNDGELSAISA